MDCDVKTWVKWRVQRFGVPSSCVTSGKSRHFSELFYFFNYKMGIT